jgi:hypothetical protein
MKNKFLIICIFVGAPAISFAEAMSPEQCNKSSVKAFQKMQILEQAMVKTGLKCKHSFEAFGCQESIEKSRKLQKDYISTLRTFNDSCGIIKKSKKASD